MNISQVIQSFPKGEDTNLTIHIGKSISKQCFSVNNKIFFDVLKTYLGKNGWSISDQYAMKRFYYQNKFLQSTIRNKESLLVGLDVPVTMTHKIIQKNKEIVKKYKGTYFDLLAQYYIRDHLETTDEFVENSHRIYSEVQEEITVFKKMNTNTQVVFSVNKEKDPAIFSVYLEISETTEAELENLESLLEIIELAMCKYKKTDHTISSVFHAI